MIYDVFISRPRLAIVISIVITLAGLISIYAIPVSQYPDIAPPTVQISATYAGADAETVEKSVAQPLEAQINGVDGMRYMRSTSGSDGSYNLTVTFELGKDPDIATVNVQNRAALAEPRLPEEVRALGMSIDKISTDLLQVFTFHSDDPSHSEVFLNNFVIINILDELKRVPGVGDAKLFGFLDYAMRIWIDPQKLANLDMTPADVIAAIRSKNLQGAAGRIGAAPLLDEQRLQLSITTKGRLSSPEEFENIIVRSLPDGSVVRVKDIAKVELDAQNYDVTATYKGKPASTIGVYLSPGANAVATAQAVTKRLEELKDRFPEGMKYDFIYNTAEFVLAMMEKVIHTLIEAFVLVAIVVFLFLGRLRPTLIPLLAVPVSVIGTFAVLLAMGYSANTISLLALILAIGIVVDDAIVVVENVEHVMEHEPHLTPAEATRKAMSQIAGPVIAITLVLLSVFVPVAFLPGSSGVLFRQFALTISAAMVISAINALTLAPALCAVLLKPGRPTGIMKTITEFIDGIGNGYSNLVRRLVRVSILSIVGLGVAVAASASLMSTIPSGFLPQEDKGFLIGIFNLPPGASLNRTIAAGKAAEEIIMKDPAVEAVTIVNGLDFLGSSLSSNSGAMFVRLKEYDHRSASNLHSTVVAPRITRALSVLPQGTFFALNPPAISGIGQAGGFEYILEALQGQSPTEMAATMRAVLVAANQDRDLNQVYSTYEAEVPQIKLEIDRDKLAVLGVGLPDVFTALQANLGSYYVNDFNLFGRTWTVQMQAAKESRTSIKSIYAIQVRNANGEMVPLSTVVRATLAVGPKTVVRYNNYRSIPINGSPAPGVGDGAALTAMDKISKTTLPSGYAYAWTGQALEQIQSAGQAPIVIGFAFVFAYLFLVALYESWNVPIPVLLSVIVGILGSLLGLLVTNMSFLLYVQIGLVVLIALAAKNAILIAEFSLMRRAEGETITQSAVSGARLRFRPVMMTSIAFIAGLIPLVRAHGPGADSMYSVGLPVIAGMLASSLVGIFFIPMLYVVFQRLREGQWNLLRGEDPEAKSGDDGPSSHDAAAGATPAPGH